MIIVNAQQGSAAWHDARLGVLTASMADRLFTPAKVELSAKRGALMNRLLAEWITGAPADDFYGTKWTEHGHQYEGEAADRFAEITGAVPHPVGFVYRDDARLVGCSPDWMMGNGFDEWEVGAEVKCPAPWTHVEWLRAGNICPRDHRLQVQFSLWVTGLPRWYFMSYCAPADFMAPWKPGASLRPLIVECEPEARYQDAFSEHVPAFLDEMLAAREELREMGVRAAMENELEPATPATPEGASSE